MSEFLQFKTIDDDLSCLTAIPQRLGHGYLFPEERAEALRQLDMRLASDPEFRRQFGNFVDRMIWGDE